MQNVKQSFIFGAVTLVACNLISKVIGAIYRVPLLKILGSEGLGLYQLIFPVFALFLVISSSGVNVAVSKFVSRETEKNNIFNIKKYLYAGFTISFCVSLFFASLLLIFAPLLSKYQGDSRLFICYCAILPSIIICSIISTFRGYFLGKHKMLYSGGLQVLEQIAKLIFSLLFATAFIKKGILYAVFGTILGITVSEVFTLIISFVLYTFNKKQIYTKYILKKQYKYNKNTNYNIKTLKPILNRKITLKQAIKQIFQFGFFISLESCILPLLGAVDSLTIVPLLIKSGLNNIVSYTLFGLEDGIVASLIAMPTVFATSFGQSLIPSIKSKDITNSTKNISESFKIVWLIGVACAFVFIFFSTDIINFLYAGGLNDKIVLEGQIVADLLKLNSFNIIYLSLLNLSSSILQGLEDSKTPVINMGVCAVVRVLVVLITVPAKGINIYGTAIADMVFYSLVFILNIRAIKTKVNLQYSVTKLFVLPLFSAVTMCLTMQLFKMLFTGLLSARITTIIMGLAGVTIYFTVLIFTKVLDVKNLTNVLIKKKSNQNG